MDSFLKFLNRLRTPNNQSLIEAVQNGYRAIMEYNIYDWGPEATAAHLHINDPVKRMDMITEQSEDVDYDEDTGTYSFYAEELDMDKHALDELLGIQYQSDYGEMAPLKKRGIYSQFQFDPFMKYAAGIYFSKEGAPVRVNIEQRNMESGELYTRKLEGAELNKVFVRIPEFKAAVDKEIAKILKK